jgi:hypothetical protein
MWQRTLIPVLRTSFAVPPSTASQPPFELGSAVFGLARTADRVGRYAELDHSALWTDVPVLDIGKGKRGDEDWYIKFE